jgi:methionyl-tRNA synthetase
MYDFQLYEAYEEVRKLAESGNIYITENAPWEKTRTIEEVNKTLQNLHKLLSKLIEMYTPLIPESAAKAKTALEKLENIILFKDIVEEK